MELTTKEIVILNLEFFTLASLVIGTAIFIGSRLLRKFKPHFWRNIGFLPSVLLAVALIGVIMLIGFVVPTMVRDGNWRNKQATCAKQVGYASPEDDNSGKATAESQAAYQQCLGPQ